MARLRVIERRGRRRWGRRWVWGVGMLGGVGGGWRVEGGGVGGGVGGVGERWMDGWME